MIWWALILIAIVSLAFSAFFSGAETGMYCLSRVRLHLAASQEDVRAKRLAALLENEPRTLCVTLIGTNVMNYLTSMTVAYALAKGLMLSELDTEVYTVMILTPIVFVFGEVVPKSIFRLHADRLMLSGSWILKQADRIFHALGAVSLFTTLASMAERAVQRSQTPSRVLTLAPKRHIATMLQDALAGEQHGEARSSLIRKVIQLPEIRIHTVMVSRNHVVSLAADTGQRALIRAARRFGYTRLAVYDTRPRRVIGFVSVDELLRRTDWQRIDECLQPALKVQAHDTVAKVIADMQQNQRHIAVVTDRGGQMLGIVTRRDALEAVVGAIEESEG